MKCNFLEFIQVSIEIQLIEIIKFHLKSFLVIFILDW